MIFKKFFNKDADKVQYFSNKFNISNTLSELILLRGINTEEKFEEFLNPKVLYNPFLLNGMKELVDRVTLAKELKDKVLIFGDYDVDGVSATAIMIKALKQFGINADWYLPNRYVDGYGLTNAVIDKIADKYNPNLIITVDCGISCYKEVEYAKNKGIEIIVTDHHEIPEIVPDTIVVNAKMPNQKYPFRELCGTGVAYKFAVALLGEVKAEEYLPIASIATIVDIVPLVDENRTIVRRGQQLCEKYLPLGLKMMFKEYDINIKNPNSTDISFKIGPKLNASGRMGDAGDSLKIYFETDPVKVKEQLKQIKAHNTKRQEICTKIYDDCEKALLNVDMRNQRVIVLASKSWDKGVLGIVCSRLVEKYHKPVFLFSQEGDLLSGSGRSINDINIHQLLSSLQEILETFGGHSMAAGLTLKRSHYEEFVKRINDYALNSISDDVFIPIKYYDMDLTEEQITEEFVSDLSRLEPFGCENPRPKFRLTASNVEIIPMKRFPQHANIKIGQLNLTYFNFIQNLVKIEFSRTKSFIFEFAGNGLKGNICEFDGGTFIVEDAYKKLNAVEIASLLMKGTNDANYKLYSEKQMLDFLSGASTTCFGTCFVAYSCFDYVDFSKNYSTQNIYHFGIYEDKEIGYNSLLLSPKGVSWAKNFSKIIFLSPVVAPNIVSAINKVASAEIYVPMEKKNDVRKFSGLDLSRETYGRIFKKLKTSCEKPVYNIFELYDKMQLENISFMTFYCAMLVFHQLGYFEMINGDQLFIKFKKYEKKELKNSNLYSQLLTLKKTFRGEIESWKKTN